MKNEITKIIEKIGATIDSYSHEDDVITIKILGSNNQTTKWIEINMDGEEIYDGTYSTFDRFYSLKELEELIVNDKEFNATSYKAAKNFYGEVTHMEAVY